MFFYLDPAPFLCDLEKDFPQIYQMHMFPVFWHRIKTLRHKWVWGVGNQNLNSANANISEKITFKKRKMRV